MKKILFIILFLIICSPAFALVNAFNNDVTISNSLTVEDAIFVTNDVDVGGAIAITGNGTVGGTLATTELLTASAIYVTDSLSGLTSSGNTIYQDSVVGAWCAVSDASVISDSFNILSITDSGTGDYTVNIATDFADANYAAVCSIDVANTVVEVQPQTAGTVDVNCLRRSDGVAIDSGFSLVIFGDQS